MYWKVISKNFEKEFLSAEQAIQYARSSLSNDDLEEVLVEECGSKACFNLLKLSAKRDSYTKYDNF